MKGIRILILLLFLSSYTFCQVLTFDENLELGKLECKKSQEEISHSRGIYYLSNALKINPISQEAHYFLGMIYKRWSDQDVVIKGKPNLRLSIKAANEFKKVIELNPKYQGEILVLDPYSMITSVWGGLSFSYMVNDMYDSAIWALRKGREFGGFNETVLESARNTLLNCSTNSLLIAGGDMDMYPLLFVQLIEKNRTDIQTIYPSYFRFSWYLSFLYRIKPNLFGYSLREMIDISEIMHWEEKEINILVECQEYPDVKLFSWKLKPTYLEKYLLKKDFVLVHIIRKNRFRQDIYFCGGVEIKNMISLEKILFQEGLIEKIVPMNDTVNIYKDNYDEIILNYESNSMYTHKNEIENSYDLNMFINAYRILILNRISYYIKNEQPEKAKDLKKILLKKYSDSIVPWGHEQLEEYAKNLLKKI